MRVQRFILLLLLRCSFAHEATTNDLSTLLEALQDFNDQEDITDELERIENNEELITTSEERDDTDKDGTMPEVQRMLESLDTSVEDAQQDQQPISYEKVGCFKDNEVDPRPLPELLADLTGEVDWYDLSKVIRKCARLASEKGYTVFGLQSFGYCRSGKDAAETYNNDGDSAGCSGGMGGRGENLVFKIIPQYPQVTVSTIAATTSPPVTETTTPLPTTEPPTMPPECRKYVTFISINRSANNDKPGSSCDDNLPRGWYRFAGPAGDRMPTKCVPLRHCGTHAPGWFSGSHPAVHEGAVRRDVCFHWRSCCSWRNSVLVRNCGAFFVYYLSPTITCNLGYCGNGQVLTTPPVTSSVTTTEPETTTSAPTTKTVKETTTPAPTTRTTKESTTTMASTTTERTITPETPKPAPTTKTTKETTTPAPTTRTTKESTTSPPTTEPPTIPRECQNYVTFISINRSANNDKPGSSCDDNLPRGWYRFAGPAGDRMPTACVPLRHCGTHAPGWFSGSHPAVHEGAVRRDVCFHWRSCCSWRNSVLVRNCGAFYVYYLSPTITCNLGYCGNGQVPTTPSVTSSVTTTEPETTTSAPTTTTVKETTTPAPTTKTTKETTTPAPTTGTTKEPTTTIASITTERSTTPAPSSRPPPTPPTAPECLNYKFLNESNRAQGYSSRNRLALCDDKLSVGWYRFSGGAGDRMPDYCVEKLSCGTHAPGWLNTTHPSVANGIIETNVCFHWGSDCCYWSATIKVRNCGGFFVYQLNQTPYCNLRYCGNKEQEPSTSPKPTTHPSPSTTPECTRYRVLLNGDRSQSYEHKNIQGAKPKCDRRLPKAWYRFMGLAGDRMPETCVSSYHCGTHAPGWLRGAHPDVSEGVVSRTVCFTWRNKCCSWRSTILVRNCGNFYVYKLQRAPKCKLRYCGVGVNASITAKPTTTKATTTKRPQPTPTKLKHGFIILCLPTEMQVHVARNSLPPFVDPSLLRLEDPRCGVVQTDENHIRLATPLDRCGTTRRTYDESVSFHNKVVAESGMGSKRSVLEFPFRCSYKELPSSEAENYLQPLYHHGQVMDSTLND